VGVHLTVTLPRRVMKHVKIGGKNVKLCEWVWMIKREVRLHAQVPPSVISLNHLILQRYACYHRKRCDNTHLRIQAYDLPQTLAKSKKTPPCSFSISGIVRPNLMPFMILI